MLFVTTPVLIKRLVVMPYNEQGLALLGYLENVSSELMLINN